MSDDRVSLTVKERTSAELGSRNVRRLRRQGYVPGVLYGKGQARAFAVAERDLRVALTGTSGLHAIVDLVIEGQKSPHHAILKEYQQDPIRGGVTHVDFHEVRLDQPIQALVTLQLFGDSLGVRQGGVIQQVSREIRVEALPTNIPEHIDVDVSALDLGGTLRLADIPAVPDVTFLDDPHETVLASCATPRGLTEAEEGLEGEEEEAAGEAGEQPAGAAGEEIPPSEG